VYRSIADTYLRHLGDRDRAGGEAKSIDVEKLRNFARTEPGILNVIEPLLTDEQIDELLGVEVEDQDDFEDDAEASGT
jgi:hypothetical protein